MLKKKRRMLLLALTSFFFSVSFYAFVDASLFGAAIPESDAPAYWIPVSTVMFLLTFGTTLTPFFWKKNILKTVREDYVGLVLLLLTPAILVSSGFLDLISASVIEQIRGNGPLNWLNYPNWWWMDPYSVGKWPIPWSIAWLVSAISGHTHTLTADMFIGSAIGLGLLFLMWTVYILSLKETSYSPRPS